MARAKIRKYKASMDIFCRTYSEAVEIKKRYVQKGFKGRIRKYRTGYKVYLS